MRVEGRQRPTGAISPGCEHRLGRLPGGELTPNRASTPFCAAVEVRTGAQGAQTQWSGCRWRRLPGAAQGGAESTYEDRSEAPGDGRTSPVERSWANP